LILRLLPCHASLIINLIDSSRRKPNNDCASSDSRIGFVV
jgi:hypothetical protein